MSNIIKSISRIIRSVVFGTLLICLVIFMINNRSSMEIHLYPLPFNIEARIFLVMMVFFLLGMLFGILICSQSLIIRFFISFKERRKIKKLEKQIKKNN